MLVIAALTRGIASLGDDRLAALFNEELGAVIRFVPLTVKRSSPYWHSMGLLIVSIM
ncbi:hypothetical protein ACLK19_17020 [Escherichia coli]